jgi:hypothetical protein
VLIFDEIGLRVHGRAVDCQQQVAPLNTGAGAGRVRRHLQCRDTLIAGRPQNTVLDLVPSGMGRDVRRSEASEKENDNEYEGRANRRPPSSFSRLGPS